MNVKKHTISGKLFVSFSIISSILIIVLNQINPLNSSYLNNCLIIISTCNALGALGFKSEYPIYYKYHIIGSLIILTSLLINKLLLII